MIKIIFNPFYGNHVYVDFDKRNSVIGEKHVNGSELINELQPVEGKSLSFRQTQ